ncbi:DUF2190 family protein [Desulfovibrio mangrovi]|uniref:DUF2190 family protein n=1 Tax=Desulfovibrio mangrovi TaxID=2976983 RepID=UPI00224682B5|nr:DUF2190 family protein [Desulfovibrio mangrovi]UZP67723.1 DUF2190 family protein [Desulfovibrio mangrovi]
MAQNHVQEGKKMNWTNGGAAAVVSGQAVVVGALVGVAAGDIAVGETGVLEVAEVRFLPKAAEAITQGAKLYWDANGNPVGGVAGSGCLTATATDNTYAGVAFAAAADTAATVDIKLNA